MTSKLTLLAEARDKKATWKANMNAIIEHAKDSFDYAESERRMKEAEELETMLTEQIKAEALEAFKQDSEKHREAVEIKGYGVVNEYDKTKAREWCLTDFRPALKLDEKVFEKAVKDGTVPESIAVAVIEYRAQIATDLSKYLTLAIPGPE